MNDHLRRRLEQFVLFSREDRQLLAELSMINVREVDARQNLIEEGDKPNVVNLVLEGWAQEQVNYPVHL